MALVTIGLHTPIISVSADMVRTSSSSCAVLACVLRFARIASNFSTDLGFVAMDYVPFVFELKFDIYSFPSMAYTMGRPVGNHLSTMPSQFFTGVARLKFCTTEMQLINQSMLYFIDTTIIL